AARYAALSELSDCQALDSRVRLRRRRQAVRVALRLLALPSCEAGRGVSRYPLYDRRYRYARRPHARQENGRAYASRSQERRQPAKADPAAHRNQSRTRPWQTGHQTDRREHRYVLVPVLAVGGETLIVWGRASRPSKPSEARQAFQQCPVLPVLLRALCV